MSVGYLDGIINLQVSLMPIMFVSYILQYIDKTSLANGAILGLRKDLVGNIATKLTQDHSIDPRSIWLANSTAGRPACFTSAI